LVHFLVDYATKTSIIVATMRKELFATIVLCAAVSRTQAALDFYDSFNYSPTGVALTNAATGVWVPTTSALAGGPTNNAGSLSYPGLQTASGDNSVLFNGTGAAGTDARNLTTLYNINNVSTLYYSLTFKVSTITTADWGGSAANFTGGSFMVGFNQKLRNATTAIGQGDAGAPLLIRTGDPNNVSGTANDFQQYQLGTGLTATTAQRAFDATHNYNPGDTLFLVLSYTFNPGASDDVVKLYVNPTPGSLEGANTPVVTVTGGTEITGSQIQSIFVRNNSVEPAATLMDDLRVGTTWEDVTPPVPEPSAVVFIGMGMLGLMLVRRFRR
jgi:hypothetical protein